MNDEQDLSFVHRSSFRVHRFLPHFFPSTRKSRSSALATDGVRFHHGRAGVEQFLQLVGQALNEVGALQEQEGEAGIEDWPAAVADAGTGMPPGRMDSTWSVT